MTTFRGRFASGTALAFVLAANVALLASIGGCGGQPGSSMTARAAEYAGPSPYRVANTLARDAGDEIDAARQPLASAKQDELAQEVDLLRRELTELKVQVARLQVTRLHGADASKARAEGGTAPKSAPAAWQRDDATASQPDAPAPAGNAAAQADDGEDRGTIEHPGSR